MTMPTDPQSPGALEGLARRLDADAEFCEAEAFELMPIVSKLAWGERAKLSREAAAALRAADRPETPPSVDEVMKLYEEAVYAAMNDSGARRDGCLDDRTEEERGADRAAMETAEADLWAAVSRLARGSQQALPEEPSEAAIQAGIRAFTMHPASLREGICPLPEVMEAALRAAYSAERSSASRPQPKEANQGRSPEGGRA